MTTGSEINLGEVKIPTRRRRNLQNKWWKMLVAKPEAYLHHHVKPGRMLMFGGYAGEPECLIAPGISLFYFVFADQCEAVVGFDDGRPDDQRSKNDYTSEWEYTVYQKLLAHRNEIEFSFGGALEWSDFSSVSFELTGGFLYPEQEWSGIIDRQVAAMNGLHAAFAPHVDNLPERPIHFANLS